MKIHKEYLYPVQFFDSVGLDPLLDHINYYFKRERTIPIFRTTLENRLDPLLFTFSDPLLLKFIKETKLMKKPLEVALKYGLRGFSKGGKNGIFYLRKGDDNLSRPLNKLIELNEADMLYFLNIPKEKVPYLKDIKIVWHNKKDERIIGKYDDSSNKAFFLGFSRY